MPRRARKPCGHPSCGKLVSGRYCTRHERQARRRYDRERGSSSERGYDARHREWRRKVLERDPVCRRCRTEPSKHADHIVPIKDGGARFDLANGQGLCPGCHNAKTAQERAGKGG